MEVKERRSVAKRVWAPLCVIVLSLAAVGGFALFSLLSCDDFLYANFMRHGLKYWLDRMSWHYESFNGRVLVHVVVQIILLPGRWFFALVSMALCFAIPALAVLADGQDRRQMLTGTALFTACLMAMPHEVLKQGLYWTSAFCNYVLPTAMLCLLILLGFRLSEGGAGTAVGYAVLAALCGATNEQSGIVTVALTAWFALRSLVKRRRRIPALLAVVLAAGGLCTIFLSPATDLRAEEEIPRTVGNIFHAAQEHLAPALEFLSTGWLIPVILAGLFLLTGLEAAKRWRPAPLLALIPALAALAWIVWDSTRLLAILLLAAALDGAALLALRRECPALLVLAGVLSAVLILPTETVAGRTLLPLCFLLLAADAVIFSSLTREHPVIAGAVPAALMCATFLCIAPMVRGFAFNWRIEQTNKENIREARQTGELFYCYEYDYEWTHMKPDSAFLEEFLLLNGLDEATTVNFYHNAPRFSVLANGERQYTAYLEEGEPIFTIRVIEAFGGVITNLNDNWTELQVTLPWCQAGLVVNDDGTTLFTLPDGTSLSAQRWDYDNRTWYRADVYTQIFGLTVEFDEAENAYIFTAPSSSLASLNLGLPPVAISAQEPPLRGGWPRNTPAGVVRR